jgi:hypothetical protein
MPIFKIMLQQDRNIVVQIASIDAVSVLEQFIQTEAAGHKQLKKYTSEIYIFLT